MIESIPETATPQFAAPFFTRFSQDESGQDLIEYALLAALVGLGSVASTQNLALTVANTFTSVQTALDNSTSPSPFGGGRGAQRQ